MATPSQSQVFNFVGLPGFKYSQRSVSKTMKITKRTNPNFKFSMIKKPKKSQKKIRKPNAFKKSQICGFWLKKANMATLA